VSQLDIKYDVVHGIFTDRIFTNSLKYCLCDTACVTLKYDKQALLAHTVTQFVEKQ